MKNTLKMIISLALMLFIFSANAADKVSLQALFKDKAIIVVDGVRHVLSTGQSTNDGVKLISTDTQKETARVNIDGKVELLMLGMVTSPFGSSSNSNLKDHISITLYPENGHFYANGVINGITLRYLVDTGASDVVLSGDMADRMNIDYKKIGRLGSAQTASDIVPAYFVTLSDITVGNITLHNVEAAILKGSYPTPTLLGMSFLRQLDIRWDNIKMELTER